MPSPVEVSAAHRLRVRYSETDQMGVVYHANYIIWFHEARDALFREAGIDLAAIEDAGYRFPIVDTSCRYMHSARYGDEVIVHAHLLRETVARLRFRFEVFHARSLRLLASGTSVSVVTDTKGKLLLRTPASIGHLLDVLVSKQRTRVNQTERA